MEIVIIIEAVVIAALIIALIVFAVKTKKPKNKADNVYTSHGVRYTRDSAEHKENGGIAVTHREGDIVLERGRVYRAVENSDFMPGKYTVLTTGEKTAKFNLRIGGIVREYSHATDIVLADGDEICAVSCAVILR